MAILSGICKSFKQELLQGIHVFGTDTIKAALYTGQASLSPDTTAYSATNEATGTNWSAGGVPLTVREGYPAIDSVTGAGVVAFEDTSTPGVTITFRAVLIYNASKANRALLVLDRGIDVVITGGNLALFSNAAQPHLIAIA